jgi:serine/threonine-protein kinase
VSPERLAGRPSDPRDDIYGLGRVIDDVLTVTGTAVDAPRWRRIAATCTQPSGERPRDASALLALIEA